MQCHQVVAYGSAECVHMRRCTPETVIQQDGLRGVVVYRPKFRFFVRFGVQRVCQQKVLEGQPYLKLGSLHSSFFFDSLFTLRHVPLEGWSQRRGRRRGLFFVLLLLLLRLPLIEPTARDVYFDQVGHAQQASQQLEPLFVLGFNI